MLAVFTDHSPLVFMAIDLLDFTQIDNDTPGVAWLALTTGQFFSTPPGGFVDIVDGTTAAARATEVIDAAYIVGGETAHVGLLRFFFSAGIQFIALRLAASSAEDGASAGPSLTADALNNLGLVVQRGTDTYKYRLVDLVGDAGDDDEPYSWSDVDPPLSLAALNALTGTDVHALLVDISNPRIDWPNLRLIDPAAVPAAPAAPTVTSTGMTSIRAAWTAPATGATPTGYDLQWRVAPNEAWTQVDDATSPHAIANLTVGATYEVQVRAYNDDGDGPWSASGQATTASANRTPTIAVINDVTVLQGEMLDLTLPDPGGDAPVALTVSGRPDWIQFDPSTRRLHGTAANAVSEIPLTYTAEDADGETASRAFNVIVPLELGDFAPAGRDRAASALLTRGGVNTNGLLYRNDDPATDDPADLGELLAGSLTPDGQRISRIRRVDATHLQLIDTPDTTDLGAFFAAGGDGRDLRIHIQDKDGSAAFDAAAATISLTGANVVRFAATADFMTIVDRIAVNQRFILAFTRAAVADLPLTAAATLGGSLSVRAALALADVEDLALTAAVTLGGSLSVAASLTLADDDDLALTAAATLGGSLSVRAELALADVEDLALTAAPTLGGSLGVAASLTLAAVDDLALTAAATLGGSLSVRSVPTLADVEELALTAAVRLRGSLGVRAALTLTGGAPPAAVPVALLLSLETDMSDGLARGYPAEIPLHGDVVMEAWHPVEAEVETRLLRTVSDAAGPAVHGRVRSLVQEVITLLAPDAALAEQTARLLNAVNSRRRAGLAARAGAGRKRGMADAVAGRQSAAGRRVAALQRRQTASSAAHHPRAVLRVGGGARVAGRVCAAFAHADCAGCAGRGHAGGSADSDAERSERGCLDALRHPPVPGPQRAAGVDARLCDGGDGHGRGQRRPHAGPVRQSGSGRQGQRRQTAVSAAAAAGERRQRQRRARQPQRGRARPGLWAGGRRRQC